MQVREDHKKMSDGTLAVRRSMAFATFPSSGFSVMTYILTLNNTLLSKDAQLRLITGSPGKLLDHKDDGRNDNPNRYNDYNSHERILNTKVKYHSMSKFQHGSRHPNGTMVLNRKQ